MEKNETGGTLCRSVFKSGESTTTQERFTAKWIELINLLEKNKQDLAATR